MSAMTIADFNKVVEIMKKIYDFNDQETQLVSITNNLISSAPSMVEVTTVDEVTGVRITMSRSAFDTEKDEPWIRQ